MMERTKPLEPEVTEIRCQPVRRRRVVDGQIIEDAAYARIKYGNLVIGQDDGKPYYVPHQQYRSLLAKFLTSPEGQEYIIPSEQEMLDAETAVIAKYFPNKDQEQKQLPEESPVQEEEQPPEPESAEKEKADQPVSEPDESKESEKSEDQPKQKRFRLFHPQKHEKKPHRNRHHIKGRKKDHADEIPADNAVEHLSDSDDSLIGSMVVLDGSAPDGDAYPYAKTVRYEVPPEYTKRYRRVRNLAFVGLMGCVILALGLYNIIPINPSGSADKHVIQLTRDVKAGDPLSMDDFKEAVIPNSQFISGGGSSYIDDSGRISTEYMVLWSNRTSVAGKYASADLSAGECLTNADYSMVSDGSDVIELSVDGKTVRVPAFTANRGTSEMKLFAIVTSTDPNGKETTVAVPLGFAEFQGRTIKDVMDSSGNTVLDQLIAQQTGE